MLKRLALLGALLLVCTSAYAADENANANNAVTNSSGNKAAAIATATLPGVQGLTTRICSFQITSSGATAASVVSPTVTGVIGGTMTFTYSVVAGATLSNAPLLVAFSPCVAASAQNTAIVVNLPSLGTGNTNASVSATGYQN